MTIADFIEALRTAGLSLLVRPKRPTPPQKDGTKP